MVNRFCLLCKAHTSQGPINIRITRMLALRLAVADLISIYIARSHSIVMISRKIAFVVMLAIMAIFILDLIGVSLVAITCLPVAGRFNPTWFDHGLNVSAVIDLSIFVEELF